MAVICENRHLDADIFFMRVKGTKQARPGQFAMLRAPGVMDPLLGRPLSFFDSEGDETSFLYHAVGKGTNIFSAMKPGQEIEVTGPLGNGFPIFDADAVLIGGAAGAAPMRHLAKEYKRLYPERRVELYAGFQNAPVLEEEFAAVADEMRFNIGGFVTDEVDFTRDAVYYACGPVAMMRAVYGLMQGGRKLYISMDERMACGVGACLGCTIRTARGNRRVCKDGPVFEGWEVFI